MRSGTLSWRGSRHDPVRADYKFLAVAPRVRLVVRVASQAAAREPAEVAFIVHYRACFTNKWVGWVEGVNFVARRPAYRGHLVTIVSPVFLPAGSRLTIGCVKPSIVSNPKALVSSRQPSRK